MLVNVNDQIMLPDGQWIQAGVLVYTGQRQADANGNLTVNDDTIVRSQGVQYENTLPVSVNGVPIDVYRQQNPPMGASPGSSGSAPSPQSNVDKDAANRDALAIIRQTLRSYDLPDSLGDWAWQALQGGLSANEILLQLYERPEFKARFPAIDLRRQNGLAPISPAEYISYERNVRQLMRSAGLPSGFYDEHSDFTKFIANDVSAAELATRINDGYVAAMQAPVEVRAELGRLYGVDSGHLAAFFLDPDRALPIIQRQFAASQISGNAVQTGYGNLNLTEAERLAALGVNDSQARSGFGSLVKNRELFGALPGQELSDATVSRDQQLGAVFEGDAFARQQIEENARRRQAQFQAGGGFGTNRQGLGGIGTADA